jgi:hypothetical protein
VLDVDGDSAVLTVPGQDAVRLAVDAADRAVRLLLDAGLAEVATSAGEQAALRLPGTGPVRLQVPAGGADGMRVTAHAMPAAPASGR